jgi:LAO/AO transport system kinase
LIESFLDLTRRSGVFEKRRRRQSVDWFHMMLDDTLRDLFFSDPEVKKRMPALERSVSSGHCLVPEAVEELVGLFLSGR